MQQTFEQAYHLGPLEKEYRIDPKKIFAPLVFILIAVPIVFGVFSTASNSAKLFDIIAGFIFFLLVGGGIMLGQYIHYRHLHIYVYSNGFFCLNGNTRKVVYWQQIKKASNGRGYLNIEMKNDLGVSIPAYISGFSEFRDRVKQEIANQRNLG